jgi:hypothetical protein
MLNNVEGEKFFVGMVIQNLEIFPSKRKKKWKDWTSERK